MRRFLERVAGHYLRPGQAERNWTEISPVNVNSGTAVDLITTLPVGTKEIEIGLQSVQQNSANQQLIIQIGAGSFVAAGYQCSGALLSGASQVVATETNGFVLTDTTGYDASQPTSFTMRLMRLSASGDWHYISSGHRDAGTAFFHGHGFLALGAEIERVRTTTVGGTATFTGSGVGLLRHR